MQEPKFASVIWEDARGSGIEAVSTKDLPHKPCLMETRGWILRDDEAGVSICNERYLDPDDSDYFRGHTFILRSMIRSVDYKNLTRLRKKNVKAPPEIVEEKS